MTSAAPDVDGAVKRDQARRVPLPHQGRRPRRAAHARRATPASARTCNRHVLTLQDAAGDAGGREFITGPSTGAARTCSRRCSKVAKLSATVLILGESGTGKELLARLLHRESANRRRRRSSRSTSRRFRASWSRARCSATRRARSPARMQQRIGKFELANGGTLFLDEIGDLQARTCRPSCCARSRKARSSGSAARGPIAHARSG